MDKFDVVTTGESSFKITEIKNISSDINLLNSAIHPEVLGCDENSLTFNYFGKSCAEGNLIMLDGSLLDGANNLVKFSFVGKVIELETTNGESNKVTIKLNQYDKQVWKKFITSLKSHQRHIDKLLQAIKGDE